MELPKQNEDYRKQEYWDSRYTTEDRYDWFTGYSAYKHLLARDIDTAASILMLGCGNSSLSEQMYQDGFKNITNTDFSPVVIAKMAEKHGDLPEMTWKVMDITDMTFEPNTFDVVLEKGTLDALMVHEKDPWNQSTETLEQINTILSQVTSILKPGGKFISITFSQPHFRRPLYACAKYNWDVNLSTFGNTFHFFYFIMNQGAHLNHSDREKEIKREKDKMENKNADEIVFQLEDDTDSFLLGICVDG